MSQKTVRKPKTIRIELVNVLPTNIYRFLYAFAMNEYA